MGEVLGKQKYKRKRHLKQWGLALHSLCLSHQKEAHPPIRGTCIPHQPLCWVKVLVYVCALASFNRWCFREMPVVLLIEPWTVTRKTLTCFKISMTQNWGLFEGIIVLLTIFSLQRKLLLLQNRIILQEKKALCLEKYCRYGEKVTRGAIEWTGK